jgi:hypothetical protein
MEATEDTEVMEATPTGMRRVSAVGEEVTHGVSHGLTQRGGGPIMMTRISTSRADRETDTTHMTSTYRPEGPWSGTMTTIGTK